ncbi:MAG TPA: GPW/gp25 family protein, partial [Gemmatimonadaceae bacterium]|nr:GPW/gp25 family protein [Gemmatimonadaceae bacterium]
NLARHYVEDGLGRWEPRIELMEVVVENDNRGGALRIHVHYRVRATQDVRSMVYPFYLEQT